MLTPSCQRGTGRPLGGLISQRTDRLFEVIQILRAADGPISAAEIPARMELSKRTVYRHVGTLEAMRLPIEGAPGVGYVMRAGYDPPR